MLFESQFSLKRVIIKAPRVPVIVEVLYKVLRVTNPLGDVEVAMDFSNGKARQISNGKARVVSRRNKERAQRLARGQAKEKIYQDCHPKTSRPSAPAKNARISPKANASFPTKTAGASTL